MYGWAYAVRVAYNRNVIASGNSVKYPYKSYVVYLPVAYAGSVHLSR